MVLLSNTLGRSDTGVGSPDDHAAELFRRGRHEADAREELVRAFYPLVQYLPRQFAGRGEPLEDLTQVACVALLKAIDRFDVTRGVKFSTYATPTIIGELKRHFRDKSWAMRVPRRLKEMGLQVRSVIDDAHQELGRSATVAEVAARAGLTEEKVVEAMDAVRAYSVDSLDAPTFEGGGRQVEWADPDEEELEAVDGWVGLAPSLRALCERERKVLHYRFVDELTQSQIAKKLGISQMHISRLLSRTLLLLREQGRAIVVAPSSAEL